MPGIQHKRDSVIWALSALPQLNRTPFDPELILQDPPYLFEGLNLALKPGQSVALMGPSGSGQIKVDGQDTRHLSANELRQNFGVVAQEATLISPNRIRKEESFW